MEVAYGRFPIKPQVGTFEENIEKMQKYFMEYDDDKHLEERIDEIRKKLHLNERFNQVMEDEKANTAEEGIAAVRNISKELRSLRRLLARSMQQEKAVVQSALDTHREFQLAMTDRKAMEALPWLEDKVHDQTKKLNLTLHELSIEQKNLQQIEADVHKLLELDENGNTVEAQRLLQKQEHLETFIENTRVKKDSAFTLRKHYRNQIQILVDDNNKLVPVSQELDKTFVFAKKELERLVSVRNTSTMLAKSVKIMYNLTRTKYGEHDKARRGILMDKRNEMKMDFERRSSTAHPALDKHHLYGHVFSQSEGKSDREVWNLARKLEEAEILEGKVLRITLAMRVKHISFCAPRMKSTIALNKLLRDELESKEDFLELLEAQSEQLFLIKTHLKFTGNEESTAAKKAEEAATLKLTEIEGQIVKFDKERNKHKANFQQIREGMTQILGCLGVSSEEAVAYESLRDLTEFFQLKVLNLIKDVNDLREELLDLEPKRDYSKFLKPPKIPKEHVRIATPPMSENGDDDDDGADILDTTANRVLGRDDIKERSMKLSKRSRLFGVEDKPKDPFK